MSEREPRVMVAFRARAALPQWAEALAVRLTGELGRHVPTSEVLRVALGVAKKHENEVRKIIEEQG